MPRKCYCYISTDKITARIIMAKLEGNLLFGLKEMEKWQKEKYENLGHKVDFIKCSTKKPSI